MVNSVFSTGNNYYPQVFLEECKYVIKEKKILKYNFDDIEISSDSDKEDSDEEDFDEENSDEKNVKNTRIVKLIFKVYKKIYKILFIIFFL